MSSERITIVTICLAVIFFLLGPIIMIPLHHSLTREFKNVKTVSCPDGLQSVLVSLDKNAAILRIHNDVDLKKTKIPDIRYGDFIRDEDFSNIEFKETLRAIKSPSTLIAYNYLQDTTTLRNGAYAIVPNKLLLEKSGTILGFCVKPSSYISEAQNVQIFE